MFKIKTAIKEAIQIGHDLVIFDQGILQDLWSIGVTGNPDNKNKFKDQLFKILHSIKDIFIYYPIHFKVHIDNATDRILKRSPSKYRFDNMEEKTILDILSRKSKYLDSIVETASRVNHHEQPVIDTNNTPIEFSAQRIVDLISSELNTNPNT